MKPRKAHVKRVYKVDDQGNVDKSTWIDVLRLDEVPIQGRGFSSGVSGAGTRYKFKWLDDPKLGLGDVQNENANTVRVTQKHTIKNPEDDSNTLDLWLVAKQKINQSSQHRDNYGDWSPWLFKHVYDNNPVDGSDGVPSKRTVKNARIVHIDLPDDLMANGPVDWDKAYLPALMAATQGGTDFSKVDSSQYVDVEYVKFFSLLFGQFPDAKDRYSTVKDRLQNDGIFSLLNAGGAGTDSQGNPTIVHRLDPLQAIVNVSWKGPPTFLGVGEVQNTVLLGGPMIKLPDDLTKWTLRPDADIKVLLDVGSTAVSYGVVDGKPVYMVGGEGRNNGGVDPSNPSIAWSNDAINWNRVDIRPPDAAFQPQVMGSFYDKNLKRFYIDVTEYNAGSGLDEYIYKSDDGCKSWALIDQQMNIDNPGGSQLFYKYIAPEFLKRVDGLIGVSDDKTVRMFPKFATYAPGIGTMWPDWPLIPNDDRVTVNTYDKDTGAQTSTRDVHCFVDEVFGVTVADGGSGKRIWAAYGSILPSGGEFPFAAVSVSDDDGITWKLAYRGDEAVPFGFDATGMVGFAYAGGIPPLP